MSNRTHAALLGGLVLGVLSGLPLVNLANVCCCFWVVAGGLLAAYLLQQNQEEPIALGDGAFVGFFAGLFGALITTVIGLALTPLQNRILTRVIELAGDMPPEVQDALARYRSGGRYAILGAIVGLVLSLIFFSIFSTLGGLLGAVFFRKQPPPGTIDVRPVTPPAPPPPPVTPPPPPDGPGI